jgi:zinc/manganese transport system substrate-binding protein
MKRTALPAFPLLLLLFLVVALPGAAGAKLRVVTSLQDFSSLAQALGGERVETFPLARGYQDPHFVDPKPSFVLQLSRADLLIVAGLDLEAGYLPPLLEQSRNRDIQPGAKGYLDASAGCEILGRPQGQVTRALGDVHPYGNPHYWTDPENGRRIARAIAARLSALDPAGRAAYERNLAAFEARLTRKQEEWRARMAPHQGLQVVTYHDSWPNFAKRFGLRVVGHVEPKPGIPPTPSHTLEIINRIRDQKIRVILIEPYVDRKTPEYIAAKSGAKVVTLYPSVGGVPAITDYFAIFDTNLGAILAALRAQ